MTIRELYEWALERGITDYEIRLQYQDDGGTYYGDCALSQIDISFDKNEVIFE